MRFLTTAVHLQAEVDDVRTHLAQILRLGKLKPKVLHPHPSVPHVCYYAALSFSTLQATPTEFNLAGLLIDRLREHIRRTAMVRVETLCHPENVAAPRMQGANEDKYVGSLVHACNPTGSLLAGIVLVFREQTRMNSRRSLEDVVSSRSKRTQRLRSFTTLTGSVHFSIIQTVQKPLSGQSFFFSSTRIRISHQESQHIPYDLRFLLS